MKQDMIVILDLGSENNSQLAREIRALGVYSEIHPHDITAKQLAALPNVKGVILNGGPNNVIDGVKIDVADEIYNGQIPVVALNHDTSKCAKISEGELKAFVFDKCGCEANWNMQNFIDD